MPLFIILLQIPVIQINAADYAEQYTCYKNDVCRFDFTLKIESGKKENQKCYNYVQTKPAYET